MKRLKIINTHYKLLLVFFGILSFTSCSTNSSTEQTQEIIIEEVKEEDKLPEIEEDIYTFFESLKVAEHYKINVEHLDGLEEYTKINKELFAELNLGTINKLIALKVSYENYALGKIAYDEFTGVLVSQVSENEYYTYLVIFDPLNNIIDYKEVFYGNSEGNYRKHSEIDSYQVITTTSTMSENGDFVNNKSVALIDNGGFIDIEEAEFVGEEYASEDPIEFAIPTTEELTAGNGILKLQYKTLFSEQTDPSKNAILFIEEQNTELIGGPPAKSYQIVSTQTGRLMQTIPISYNPAIGEGVVLMPDMSEEEITEFNKTHAEEAGKALEEYSFDQVFKFGYVHQSYVELKENEWVFSIAKVGEEEIKYEVGRIPSVEGRTIEITDTMEPLSDPFAIILFTIPGSMQFPETLNGVFVVGKSKLSLMYKKIGFAYYNKIQSEKDVDDENAIKSISYLNSSLLLNGANAEAAYYLASTYAMIGSDHKCIQALQHLKLIESSDSEGYLKMVKEEITFNKIRNNTLFIEFINAIDY